MLVATTHIDIRENGVAWIAGANTKVIEVVLDKIAYGWNPEEIHFQHPHLSMAQIHATLAFYYENQQEIDAEVQRQLEEVDRLREKASKNAFSRNELESRIRH